MIHNLTLEAHPVGTYPEDGNLLPEIYVCNVSSKQLQIQPVFFETEFSEFLSPLTDRFNVI